MRTVARAGVRGDEGAALIVTLAFIMASLSALELVHRRTLALMQVEQNEEAVEAAQEALPRGMAQALVLLETGLPPADDYICSLPESGGAPRATAHFLKDDAEWRVTVSTGASASPACPADFGGEG